MTLLEMLLRWCRRRPLVLVAFPPGYENGFLQSKHGLERFTWAERREKCGELRLPTICIVEMRGHNSSTCYAGVLRRKASITTIESRLTIERLRPIKIRSLFSLIPWIGNKWQRSAYEQRVERLEGISVVTPALSAEILNAIISSTKDTATIEMVAADIPGLRPSVERTWEQFDAIKTAMAAFGLVKSEPPKLIETKPESDSTLRKLGSDEGTRVKVLEDNVLARDSSVVPGFELIQKTLTGRAVFVRGKEQLVIYTANRGPLENMLGVDLIYVNQRTGNVVMVQYKMLEPYYYGRSGNKDWIARVDDQFQQETSRMALPVFNGPIDDYRIHPNPFFIKFIRRVGDGENHNSFILTLDHFHQLITSSNSRGPRGGVRISYDGLEGVYLRDTDLLGLIRSGYIGTHRNESKALSQIISRVAEGQRGLVLAWQRLVESNKAAGSRLS